MIPPSMDARVPYIPPSAPAPADEGPADFLPDWLPTLSPQDAALVAAVAGGLVLVLALVAVIRRWRRPATPAAPSTGKAPDPWVRRLIGAILVTAPALLALTFYGSFYAVEAFAADRQVNPSWVPPLAIDGTLVVFLLFDLLFARLGRPNTFVKQTTRGFIALTLVANAAAGWGDLAAVFLHIPAPLAIVVLTEVSRRALVDQARRQSGKAEFDPIPLMRWVLAPRTTFGIWRWMILQDVRSYSVALGADHDRRDALAIIDAAPAGTVPAYLSRRLRAGMDVSATAARVRAMAGVDEVDPLAASSTPGVDEGTTPASTSTADRVDVHVESTHPSTPAPAGGVDEAPVRVDHRVDAAPADEAPAPVADPAPTPAPTPAATPVPAPRVDEVDAGVDGPADGVDVHMGQGWRTPGVHHAAPGPVWDEAPNEVDANGADEAPAPVVALDTDTDGDEDGPDDEGPGPRGGGAPTPVPVDVVPGQITVEDALAQVAAPSPLDVARVALDAPVWDDLDEAATKKAQVMALLWEFSGDAAAVRDAYAERTGQVVPRDLYRKGSRGYAWAWHHQVTAYLIREYGHADTVRAVLADAGVDHDHEAVTAALDEWETTHGSQVLQFRRVPLGT